MPETLGPFNLILLAIPGIGLRLALRILYSTRSRTASDPLRSVLSLASTLMIIVAVLGSLIALTGPAIVPLAIVGIVAALMVHDRLRRAEHRALLWTLTVAAQKGIPLSEAARAYADECEGDTGYRALRVAQAVEAGEPLSAAVRRARLRMAPAMRLALGLGERLGMLGPAMKQQLDDSQQADATLRDTIGRFVYLGFVLLAFANIMTFLMLKIVPVFEKMFQEFEVELPESTVLVIHLSNLAVNYWFLVPLAISIPLAFGSIFFIVMYLLENLHTDYSNRPVERFLLRPRRIVRIILALLPRSVLHLAALRYPIHGTSDRRHLVLHRLPAARPAGRLAAVPAVRWSAGDARAGGGRSPRPAALAGDRRGAVELSPAARGRVARASDGPDFRRGRLDRQPAAGEADLPGRCRRARRSRAGRQSALGPGGNGR